jgi:dTDP-4-dehydrorhamnose reductase
MLATGRILVLGGSGLLGESVRVALARDNRPCSAPGRDELDLTDTRALSRWLDANRPSAVINAAAYSDVTRADRKDQHAQVFRLNRDAPAALARLCHRYETPFVFISTDFVFGGESTRPYVERDRPDPIQVYGRSKLEGERAVASEHPGALIVRTSTLFGPGRRPRPHYVDAVLAQARRRSRVEVVREPVSSPTYTPDLARCVLDLLTRGCRGVLHVVNDGGCSRLQLAREAVRVARLDRRVEVVEREEAAGGPRRPRFSVLDTSELAEQVGRRLRSWDTALAAYLGRPEQ